MNEKKKILIMGAGIRGRGILRYFRNTGVDVFGFLDNCAEKWGTVVDGIRVYRRDAFCDQKEDVVVIVSPLHSEALELQLREEYSYVIGEKEANKILYLPESAGYKMFFPLGHFYSLYPDVDKLKLNKESFYDISKPVYGIDFNELLQIEILKK